MKKVIRFFKLNITYWGKCRVNFSRTGRMERKYWQALLKEPPTAPHSLKAKFSRTHLEFMNLINNYFLILVFHWHCIVTLFAKGVDIWKHCVGGMCTFITSFTPCHRFVDKIAKFMSHCLENDKNCFSVQLSCLSNVLSEMSHAWLRQPLPIWECVIGCVCVCQCERERVVFLVCQQSKIGSIAEN